MDSLFEPADLLWQGIDYDPRDDADLDTGDYKPCLPSHHTNEWPCVETVPDKWAARDAKMRVMCERMSRGEDLHHPDDAALPCDGYRHVMQELFAKQVVGGIEQCEEAESSGQAIRWRARPSDAQGNRVDAKLVTDEGEQSRFETACEAAIASLEFIRQRGAMEYKGNKPKAKPKREDQPELF
jgi:hypothetical protein